MRLFGLDITRTKKSVTSAVNNRGWFPIGEPYGGAWQDGAAWTVDTVLAYQAVYACISLIQSDIGKLPFTLQKEDSNGISKTVKDDRYSALLKRPNGFQNHIQFKEWWVTSKLIRGNTYVLKGRNSKGVVTSLHVLDSMLVTPLVTDSGEVFYQLGKDDLGQQKQTSVTVPASEIIHDRMNCLYHPLVGVSPLFACGTAASQGLEIQADSKNFFANRAAPGGVLTAPGLISDETAARLKTTWSANWTGTNAGKIAVMGDGLKFEPMRMTAVDSQLMEQLKWSAEVVCSTFKVPAYKVGVGSPPTYTNIEATTRDYYSQCLQTHIESMELCLDEGLGLEAGLKTQLDLDVLFRMDTETQIKTLKEGVSGGIYAPNEARKKMNLSPVDGGESPYLQQQNFSLAALAKRDTQEDPFGKAAEPVEPVEIEDESEEQAKFMAWMLEKELTSAEYA